MKKRGVGSAALFLSCVFSVGTCFAVQADGFTFRNGVTWGMTKAEVIETEEYDGETNDNTEMVNGRELCYLEEEDVTAAGFEADAEYIFMDDSLHICGYEFEEETDLEKLLKSMDFKYGPSEPVDWDLFAQLMKPMAPEDVEDTISHIKEADYSCSWDVSDELYIMLYRAYEDDNIELAYMDKATLLLWAEESETEEEINTEGL